MKPRAVFMGTPEFAVPCLSALSEVADVVLVVTQPDKPQGRGLSLTPPPVKLRAADLGLPVFQPDKARDGRLRDALREARAELALVVAYGKILPRDVLDAPRLGCVNVHASLLPRHRGAAPIQWAIVEGDAETGVCLMQMDEGMDTGAVLERRVVPIEPSETGGELFARLSTLSAELVREAIPRFVAGELTPVPQASEGVTHARMIRKEDAAIDFAVSAQAVHDRVRGFQPWPSAYTALGGERIKVHRTHVVQRSGQHGLPGSVIAAGPDGIAVACAAGVVAIDELQLEGKKRVTAAQFCAGRKLAQGERFASHAELVGTRGAP
jgi:methionyl-tRNA formyltransferase